MRVADAVSDFRSTMRASFVYAEPIDKNGVTIIPAATITGGGGGGGDQHEPQAGGLGFGLSSKPAGAFVIKGDVVTWQPAIDVNRAIFMGQVVAIVALVTARAIVKAVTRRR